MKVKLLRDWNGYKATRVLQPNSGVANVLIRRGIAVMHSEDEKPARPKTKAKRKIDDAVRTDGNDAS